MPEARDRLSRQEDVSAPYSYRRRNFNRTNVGRVNPVVLVLEDEGDEGRATGTPFRWRSTAMVGTPGPIGVASGSGSIGTPRIGRVPNFGRSSALSVGRENLPSVLRNTRGLGGGRGRGSTILPSWYPRKPLRDITAVVRAIERRRRRRAHRGESESPLIEDMIHNTSPSTSSSAVHLEHDISMISPHPTIGHKRCPPTLGKVPRILLNITNNHNNGNSTSACLTPQKKLLENIDTVEKVVMEELRKLKRSSSGKKAEREKRVRTLMSLR